MYILVKIIHMWREKIYFGPTQIKSQKKEELKLPASWIKTNEHKY